MLNSLQEIRAFINRWQASGAAERSNFAKFMIEFCDIIGVDAPKATMADEQQNAYVFEKAVPLPHGTIGRIDLYKRGCFVLEAKQGSRKEEAKLRRGTAIRGTASWDTAMEKAKQQAQSYARGLPADEIREGRPPFLIVVDIGNSIALYAEFTRTGGHYIPFPDPSSYRLPLSDLLNEEVRLLLRQLWVEPLALSPARRSAKVTREIADHLAKLAKSLEAEAKYAPSLVANFLMRSLFTMFAEDVGLLPKRSFLALLLDLRRDVKSFQPMLEHLWQTMNTGGFSVILRTEIPLFNGGLFADSTALPLSEAQLDLLILAAKANWRDVEPAIFGTLLERALSPIERHKLGAHYTPRAYVERLVQPTVIEPLRTQWDGVQTAALLWAEEGKTAQAIAEIEAFQKRLATIRILDPACGSGNFLYVTLELLKRLEGEVLAVRQELGAGQALLEMEEVMVTPRQFLGLEINPRAAAIAELVLWIGYLQWHFRTRGKTQPPSPIIKNYRNIECRDAVLEWDEKRALRDKNGQAVTRWDGHTTKTHPVTSEQVPDETARIPLYQYINPRPAVWPDADFVVGNPPFIGTAKMRETLGDGYTEAVRKTYKSVPNSTDYVMYWWHITAELTRQGKVQRFGFITTNSLRQTLNRRILQSHLSAKKPLSLLFAIPDHPWVDASDGADVRIAMTVAQAGEHEGLLKEAISETVGAGDAVEIEFLGQRGLILADLTIGANVAGAVSLKGNEKLSSRGVMICGSGFLVTPDEAVELGLGRITALENYILDYRNGRDMTQRSRHLKVIDLDGLTIDQVRARFPEIYQRIYEKVKPSRDQNQMRYRRENWWLFGAKNTLLRSALSNLERYISTVETAKHRFFTFLDQTVRPDNMLVNIGLEDAYFLAVLSSRIHVTWALATGGRLGIGNDPRYNKTRCFETFPFPDASEAQKEQIRQLGEQLDAHRKRQQALHPKLTMTGMYNVLQKLRTEQPLTTKEKAIHKQGLVSLLKQLHDELDRAVFDAYGWQPTISDDELLEKLVALNAVRASEEAKGVIRWLRPDYQNPNATPITMQSTLIEKAKSVPKKALQKQSWPKTMPEQAQAVRHALALLASPATAEDVTSLFGRRTTKRIKQIGDWLKTLASLGQARQLHDGRFVAA